jgi:catechol 2,3-dioxygenase-like lactoylglutathione lyase family enzyme
MKSLSAVTFLVREYDEAIAWFCDKLGFQLIENTRLSEAKRWVRVAPNEGQTCFLLARADSTEQRAAIGKAAGGRVAFFLQTNDFTKDFTRIKANGVSFLEEPRAEAYGIVAVFEDLYGNKWDLIQPASNKKSGITAGFSKTQI